MKGVGAAIAQLGEAVRRQPLRRGSKITAVKVLQHGVANKGFNPGYQAGIFGRKTSLAVRNFQRASGLVVDSIVGPATWKALFG